MADMNTIAQQFTEFYYNTFDNSRNQLAGLYRDNSMLTFETGQFLGATSIAEKLSNLPFQKVQHKVDTTDAQPSPTGNGILVLVTGQLLVDEEARPMSYVQSFQLLPEGGSYYVFNDIFRLIYNAA